MGNRNDKSRRKSGAVDTEKPHAADKKTAEWSSYERKVETIGKRDFALIAKEWRAHIPSSQVAATPPETLLHNISSIEGRIQSVPKTGSLQEIFDAGRSIVLHEGIYLLNKAVHIQNDVADAISKGRHTVAYINGYQGALFALSAILALLGISHARAPKGGAGVILIDIWPEEGLLKKPSISSAYDQTFKLVRFQGLEHYQKWAVLKRALRQTKFSKAYFDSLREALDNVNDLKHAYHRNQVNYISNVWLSDDLIVDVPNGPFTAAASFQDHYDAIFENQVNSTVYSLVALVEVGCAMLSEIGTIDPESSSPKLLPFIATELAILNRRLAYKPILCNENWDRLP